MIKEARIKLGMSQSEVATKLGVTQGLISQIEKGETSPSVNLLIKLADLFKCSIDDLVKDKRKEE